MIHEILKILDTTDLQELEKQKITTDLLRLFNVVGQNEQLLAFLAWIDPSPEENAGRIREDLVKEYLIQKRPTTSK